MNQTAYYKISSPSGASFIVLQNQPAEIDPYEEESFISGPLRFFSNLMNKIPSKKRTHADLP